MLRIGEFSSLTGISIYMLRNYDKIGLLCPSYVDNENGYRFYDEKQIVAANRIQILKGLSFGLKEIKQLNSSTSPDVYMKKMISNKINEKENEICNINNQLKQLKDAVKEIDNNDRRALTVTIKTLPERKVASVRGIIHNFSDEGILWNRLTEAGIKYSVKFSDTEYSFAITHKVDFKNMDIDTEVQRVVDVIGQDRDEIKFLTIPKMLVAAVAFCGVYNQIENISKYIYKWISENGYEVCGKSFNTYYKSPGNEDNPEDFITEICFPVQKLK